MQLTLLSAHGQFTHAQAWPRQAVNSSVVSRSKARLYCVAAASSSSKPTVAVIGGSVAGMLTAAALADMCDVVVLDKDALLACDLEHATPLNYLEDAHHRSGCPQYSQAHNLPAKGAELINGMLPGTIQAIVRAGGSLVTPYNTRMVFEGRTYHYLQQRPAAGPTPCIVTASRVLLEHTIRAMLAQQKPCVQLLRGVRVSGLMWSPDGASVQGVQLKDGREVAADLVVDASGRNSTLPRYLRASGRQPAVEVEVDANASYSMRIFELPESERDTAWGMMYIRARPPAETRNVLLQRIENNWAIVNLAAVGEKPARTEADFNSYLAGLPDPCVWQIVQKSKPLTQPLLYRGGSNMRRHYEKVDLPDRLAVIGDSLCSFNPGYGQGITVAALEVVALQSLLQERAAAAGGRLNAAMLGGVSAKFQAGAGKIADFSFNLNSGEDFKYPHTRGERPRPSWVQRAVAAYVDDLQALAAEDFSVWLVMYSVQFAMMMRPEAFFAPGIVLKVLLWRARNALAQLSGRAASAERRARASQPNSAA